MSRRVFNITDGSTAALRNQHLENQHIRVGETIIPPGKFVDIRATARELNDALILVKIGALALDELPAAYAAKRGLNIDGSVIPKEEEPPHPPPVDSPMPTPPDPPVAPDVVAEPEVSRKKGR